MQPMMIPAAVVLPAVVAVVALALKSQLLKRLKPRKMIRLLVRTPLTLKMKRRKHLKRKQLRKKLKAIRIRPPVQILKMKNQQLRRLKPRKMLLIRTHLLIPILLTLIRRTLKRRKFPFQRNARQKKVRHNKHPRRLLLKTRVQIRLCISVDCLGGQLTTK